MKNILLLSILSLFTINSGFSQCSTAVNSFGPEGFNGGVFPTCWYNNGVSTVFDRLNFITSGNGDRWIVLPKVENCKGILEFDARNATNGQVGFCDFQIGAVATSGASSMSSFELITSVDVYATISGNQVVYAHYTVDLSSYTGSSQYIAIMLPQSPSRTGHIDNIEYESACISSGVTALAQDISVQLDETGLATITADDVDNGSSSDCDVSLSIDISQFTCDDIGPNTVTLAANDNQGNIETATATVTVLEAINDESVSANATVVCEGESTTIETGSSVNGIAYYLRDDADDSIIDGPVIGDGSSLSFNTGAINQTTTFNVEGRPQDVVSQALDFSPTNGYVNFGMDNRGISTQVTVSAWIKSTVTGENQFIVAKYNGVNGYVLYFDANGKVRIDGRDGAGVYRQSAPSITSVNDGQWHYITGIVDVTTGLWGVYVDGVYEAALVNGTGTTLAAAYNLTLGQYVSFSMTVAVDQLSIWNQVLDPTQVANSMNNCLTGAETGLVGLFQFDEGSGTLVEDLSPTGIDGTLTGNAVPWITGPNNACIVPNTSACDREMTDLVTVTVSPSYNLTESASVCEGEMYTFPDGSMQSITSQTVHTSNLLTVAAQCDSVIETTVNVNPTYDLAETETVCFDGSFTFPDGTTQNNIQAQVVYTSNLSTVGTQCDSIIETTVNVNSVDVSTSQNGNTLTATQTGATYQWVDCDNSNAPISGEENQDFTPTSSGNYAVEVTVNGCTETSACTNMMLTGISESGTNPVRIYPNPVRETLFIELISNPDQVSILSANGAMVRSFANVNRIDVSDLSKGMYILQVNSNNELSRTRFVKE